ncbi:hypothetical protein BTM25_01380 [Actinomadura rubteroloni]|uniref:DUF4913 domain-containing protein n=1 Tax=Actinomadura rubteroloni TaxID=1926885 RepID=A0A2P4UL42_9ACTN|nr:DUF4913 domain-containing protein [Actinomadura rubteroloni]POM25755.1 hypothetical protein BTM25_01380 [Actinomadura rubteroloni]
MSASLADAGPDGPDAWASDTAEPEPLFSNPEEFVVEFLSPLIQRRLGGSYTWCPRWWAHAEGLLRITALWETWEHFRYEGALGMSTWLLHHADPHLAVLLSKDNGPFSSCKPDRHVALPPLPHEPAPDGMWMAAAFSDSRPDGMDVNSSES